MWDWTRNKLGWNDSRLLAKAESRWTESVGPVALEAVVPAPGMDPFQKTNVREAKQRLHTEIKMILDIFHHIYTLQLMLYVTF